MSGVTKTRRLGALACLAATAVAAVAIGACGDEESSSENGPSELVTSTPAPSGEIDSVVWNHPEGEPTTLDPGLAPSTTEWTILANMCESPMILNNDGTVEPGLADEVEFVNPTEIAIHIRDDAQFWNGDPVTSEDVVYSLERAMDPELSLVSFLTANVKAVQATGPQDVRITLTQPDALYFRLLATNTATIQQKSFVEEQADRLGTPDGGLMCTGAYELENWQRGQSITVVRNDDWWNQEQLPQAREIEFRFITDEATLTAALNSGDVDGTYEAPLSGVAQLRESSVGTFYSGPSPLIWMLMPSASDSILTDPQLREAIRLSIDYDGIIDAVFAGEAQAAANLAGPGEIGISREIYKDTWEEMGVPEQDLERARQLVEEAGAVGEVVNVPNYSDVSSLEAGVNTIIDGLQDIGLEVKQESIPINKYFPTIFDPEQREKYDFLFASWNMDIGDPLTIYSYFAPADALVNTTGYDDPKVTKLLEEARGTIDDDARSELVAEAAKRYGETGPPVPIALQNTRLFMNDEITGAPPIWTWLWNPWAPFVGAS